jgi:nucleolar protein 56
MEERLKFLSSGTKPRKNKEAMNDVIEELKKEGLFYGDKVRVPRGEGDEQEQPDKKKKKDKKDKKEKKRKHSEIA